MHGGKAGTNRRAVSKGLKRHIPTARYHNNRFVTPSSAVFFFTSDLIAEKMWLDGGRR